MPPADPALAYLATFTDYEQRLDVVPRAAFALDRFERLLERLGSPHLGRRAVHVAGTKGKGATTAFADAILRAHGVRTLRYLSPHVERLGERIAVDGVEATPEAFARWVDAARPAFDAAVAAGEPPTFFEALTALAFVAAREAGVACDVLETGLGGRLDATNVCRPTATAITSVDLDHVRLLGATHELIAAEKAGIVKRGAPLYAGLAPHEPGAAVVRARAAALDAPFAGPGEGIEVSRVALARLADGRLGARFDGVVDDLRFVGVEAPGGAAHQAMNVLLAAGLARRVLADLGRPFDVVLAARAVAKTPTPARAEEFPGPPDVLLDGAHTPRSVAALAALVAALRPRDRATFVLGATAERDAAALFAPARALGDRAVCVALPSPRTADPARVAAAWRGLGGSAETARDVSDATDRALAAAAPAGLVVVLGSFYLAGSVRAELRRRGRAPRGPA